MSNEKANVSASRRLLADDIENYISIGNDGTVVDPDFVSKTLPKDLTLDQFQRSLNHVSDIVEATEVVVAEKATRHAKDNAEFDSTRARVRFTDRVSGEVKWTRDHKNTAGEVTGRGRLTTKLAFQSSEEHKANQVALEQFATDYLK